MTHAITSSISGSIFWERNQHELYRFEAVIGKR
jgi:hypothetical protein